MDAMFFDSPDEAREWFEHNHASATELWIGFHKKGSGRGGATYQEVLDEALCYGWIDGVRKSLGVESFAIRFTPRRPGSIWSAVNIARVEELIARGRMQPPGLRAFEARADSRSRVYSYEQDTHELDTGFEATLKENVAAWDFFQSQAPWYRRTATHWVMSAKREETRRRRLATLIDDSAHGRRLGHLISTARSQS
jgi:uncharacterized protein YdeI (YjbR/CyaY-like superfamily)